MPRLLQGITHPLDGGGEDRAPAAEGPQIPGDHACGGGGGAAFILGGNHASPGGSCVRGDLLGTGRVGCHCACTGAQCWAQAGTGRRRGRGGVWVPGRQGGSEG